MKSTIENTGGLERKIQIEVPANKVTTAFDRAYRALQKEANLKGFRKGKAPMDVIKSTYSEKVKGDVVQNLVSESYIAALQEHELNPISQPQVDFTFIEENKDFSFTATIEVRPEVNLKKFEKLKVEREVLTIDEKRIDEVIERIRESRVEMTPVLEDRPAQNGDTVEIDFNGLINGAPLEGGQAEKYPLELGSNSLIPGFEEAIVGMNVGGEANLKLNFPADYGNTELAGKPVEFNVKLHSIKKKTLPEVTDEFAKSLGGYEDLAGLKKAIRDDLEQDETKRISEDFKGRLLKELVKNNPVDVPDQLKTQQKAALVADVEKRLSQQGMSATDVAEYKKKWDSDFDETASFMIQSSFLIDALAEKWQMDATKDELKQKLEEYSKQTGLDMGKLKEFYGEGSRMNQLEHQITEQKVVNKLTELADIKDVAADKLKDKDQPQ